MRGLTATRAIIEALVAEHRGRIANTAGDAVLAEFSSVVAGLVAALRYSARSPSNTRISRPTAASSSASGCMSPM